MAPQPKKFGGMRRTEAQCGREVGRNIKPFCWPESKGELKRWHLMKKKTLEIFQETATTTTTSTGTTARAEHVGSARLVCCTCRQR